MPKDVLISGAMPFKVDTPYKLVETGGAGAKPLLVYLHGFNQNIEGFQKRVDELLTLEAYHLFIQAPYPVYSRSNQKKKVEEWGRSWYLYDGEQDQFVKSLELASQFVEQVIERMMNQISVTRVALIGYSMGGYLAGYFGLSRWKLINEMIVIGARIKTEVFKDQEKSYSHLNVLALHGNRDESVKSGSQKKSCEQLVQWNASVEFKELAAAHNLRELFVEEAKKWLLTLGYK